MISENAHSSFLGLKLHFGLALAIILFAGAGLSLFAQVSQEELIAQDAVASQALALIPHHPDKIFQGAPLASEVLGKTVTVPVKPPVNNTIIVRTESINLAQLQQLMDTRISQWQALGKLKGEKGDQGPAGSSLIALPTHYDGSSPLTTTLSVTNLNGTDVTGTNITSTNSLTANNATFTGNVILPNATVSNLTVSSSTSFSGNVGIGTTTPVDNLSVVGDSTLQGRLFIGSGAGNRTGIFNSNTTVFGISDVKTVSDASYQDYYTQHLNADYTSNGNTQSDVYGLVPIVNITGPGDWYGASGIWGGVSSDAGGTVGNVQGQYVYAANYGSGKVTNMIGSYAEAMTNGGPTSAVTNAYGVYSSFRFYSGTTTNRYGVYINSPGGSGGALTNNYGLYVANQARGTNNFNIYSTGAASKNYFEGKIGIGTTTPVNALSVIGSISSSALNTTNGIVYTDNTGKLLTTAQGGAGTLCLVSTAGGTPTWGACSGSAATAWSSLTAPSANLSVNMSSYTTAFTYGNATGANNLFTLTDTANNTGTGYLLKLTTANGSVLNPFSVTASGTPALIVLANGNVGIGTSSPAAKLDIAPVTANNGKAINLTASADTDGDTVQGIYNTLNTGSGTLTANRKARGIYNDITSGANRDAGWNYFSYGYGLYNDLKVTGQSAYGFGVLNKMNVSGTDWVYAYGVDNSVSALAANASVTGVNSNFIPTSIGDGASMTGSYNGASMTNLAAGTSATFWGTYNAGWGKGSGTSTLYGEWSEIVTGPKDTGYGFYLGDGYGNSTGGTLYGMYFNFSDTDVTYYPIYQSSNYGSNILYANTRIGGQANPVNALSVTGIIDVSGRVGIASTTPSAQLAIQGVAASPTTTLLTIASSSGSTLLTVLPSGNVGVGTSSPANILSVQGTSNFTGHMAVGNIAQVNAIPQSYGFYYSSSVQALTVSERATGVGSDNRASGIASYLVADPSASTDYNGYYAGNFQVITNLNSTANIPNSQITAGNFTAMHNASTTVRRIMGGNFYAGNEGVGTPSAITGISVSSANDGTGLGTIDDAIVGADVEAGSYGSNNVSYMMGVDAGTYASGYGLASPGTVTTAVALRAMGQASYKSRINTYYALDIETAWVDNGGYIGNNYGLYIKNQNAGSLLNYAIYTNQAASSTAPLNSFTMYNNGTAPSYFAGNIGIGTTTPGYPLHVYRATDGDVAGFRDANGTCTINPTNTALVCSSDARLKKDVTDMQSVLDKLGKVRAVDFKWLNQTDDASHVGFIAQELEEIFPEMVQTNSDGYKSVAYTNFVPILTKAIQEQQDEIQAIKAQLQGTGDNANQDNLSAVTTAFQGNLSVKGHLYLSSDSIGQAKILSGATSTRITFTVPYEYQPVVTITPLDKFVPAFVANADATGFTIAIDEQAYGSQTGDVVFSWHAFASPEAKLTVSDGSVQNIELVVPVPPTPAVPEEENATEEDQGSPEVLGQTVTEQPKDTVDPSNTVDEKTPPKEEIKTPDNQTPPTEAQDQTPPDTGTETQSE